MASADYLSRLLAPRGRSWIGRVAAFLVRPRSRRRRLDPRTLPDHLRRDMGFADGNDPRGRRAQRPDWPDMI
ncbi:hypothetical protein [Nitratireductor sp. StC3]|uniref:hypothetical protein n=1 Tax=Nitratireductor sp. StC3 TaxID=2126741 RepID=UPI000D0C9A95|nr:hypothetical protein [Nitratireductor sp. StC3]PSM17677.1 hypothetical protein C7T96_11850 [Nitratireductor sp. StC3]